MAWSEGRIVFRPGDGSEKLNVGAGEIAEMRLGGRSGADANRIDLILLSGERMTLLVVGRERLVAQILDAQGWGQTGWEQAGREHAAGLPDV